jgi:hypothetical protein
MIVDFYYRSNSNDFPMIRFMVFNATFNNISVILWRSVLFAEETEYLEKTTEMSQVTDSNFPNKDPCGYLYNLFLFWIIENIAANISSVDSRTEIEIMNILTYMGRNYVLKNVPLVYIQ